MYFAMGILGFTVSTIWAVIILFIWIAIAFWPARVAARKGHSFFGWFLLSLFFWWITLFVAYLMPDRSRQRDAAPLPAADEE